MNMNNEIITLIIATKIIRVVIIIILKSKIEIQLNIFWYFDSTVLTERLFFSIDFNLDKDSSVIGIFELS